MPIKGNAAGSEFEVRDLRNKKWFVVDDIYLNGWARKCGIYATGVYFCLCRHADNETQRCFPSVSLIAKKLNISEIQVKRALKILVGFNIIKVERTPGRVNVYYLLDKKQWTDSSISQIPVSNRYDSSISQIPEPVSDRYPKDTNIRGLKKDKIYTLDSDEIRLSELLLDKILFRNPGFKKPNIQKWAQSINLMIRLDNRTSTDIKKIIEWSQSDPFWQKIILSTAKLREKFDQLWENLPREQVSSW